MNVVDSSGWLEYYVGSELSSIFRPVIEDRENLIVPTIAIYEVTKKVLLERGEGPSEVVERLMHKGHVVVLDPMIAHEATRISIKYKLPMADSIIYATALAHNAIVWSSDSDFKDLPNVRYFEKRKH
jgi:toxin FitB